MITQHGENNNLIKQMADKHHTNQHSHVKRSHRRETRRELVAWFRRGMKSSCNHSPNPSHRMEQADWLVQKQAEKPSRTVAQFSHFVSLALDENDRTAFGKEIALDRKHSHLLNTATTHSYRELTHILTLLAMRSAPPSETSACKRHL